MFLNVSIHKEAKIQFKCKQFDLLMLIQLNKYAIAQFHKS